MTLDPSDVELMPELDAALTVEEIEALAMLPTIDDEAMMIARGELAGVDGYPTCPPPSRWRLVGQERTKGSFRQVSSAVSAKAAPVLYRFQVQRSVTISAAVTGGLKVGLPGLEQEVGIKLETSVTFSTSESVEFRIPKGQVMALYAGAGHVVRTFQRVVYGSALCNKVVQTTEVTSPYTKFLEVRRL